MIYIQKVRIGDKIFLRTFSKKYTILQTATNREFNDAYDLATTPMEYKETQTPLDAAIIEENERVNWSPLMGKLIDESNGVN